MAKDDREQRVIDREQELARQEAVRKAVQKHELQARKDAEKALQDQRDKEAGVTGIHVVEGKP